MNKTIKAIQYLGIILLISLLVVFVIYEIEELVLASNGLKQYLASWENKTLDPAFSGNTFEDLSRWIKECRGYVISHSILVSFIFIGIAYLLFLFVFFTPRLFRGSTWVNLSEEWAKNKQERAAARQAKAETDKQKRIEELQKELDELHGSDKSD